MRLFLAKGYGAISIADILAETRINSGSLCHAFPGKRDLLLAELEAYRTGIGAMLLAPAWVAGYRRTLLRRQRWACP